MKVSTVSCCPCSWPYFLTLSYISGRQDHNMEETVKPASLSLKSVNQSLCTSQGPPVSISSPSDTSESVKSPNMSTDSGFEGENNRPSLLQTSLPSPSKDMILSSWRSKMYSDGTTALNFDGSDSTSPKSPKKSTDDSDFNESPFDKKSVPSVGDGHSESDNECGSEHNCTFFSTDASWVRANNHLSKSMCDDKKLDSFKGQISAFSICLSRGSDDPDDKCANKNSRSHVEFGECLTCRKVHYIHCRNCVDCTHCSQDVKWCGTLSSIRECKDHVIYAEGEVNSENDYDIHCKPDTETDISDDKIFEGNYSDNETLSAYYVPSNVSCSADEYHLTVKLPDEKKSPISEAEESTSEEERASPCLCHIGMCKSERCLSERSKYTTVLKPKAVRPPVNHNRLDYHSSLESLHSQHVVAVIGQHHDRLSAFHERPSSSLSQNEGMHYFFSRSLDMPPSESLTRHTTSQLSVVTASNFPTSNSCLFSEASGHRSSLTDMSTIKRCDQSCKKRSAEAENSALNCREVENRSSHHSSSSSEVESPKTRTKRFSMPCDINKNEACHSQFSHYDPNSEPIHMTLEEVHTSLQTLNLHEKRAAYARSSKSVQSSEGKSSLGFLGSYLRQKKCKKDDKNISQNKSDSEHKNQRKSFPVIIKSAFNNFFGLKKNLALPISKSDDELPSSTSSSSNKKSSPNTSPFTNRALPPLPVNGIPEWDGADDDEQWTLGGSQSQIYDRESEEDFVRRKMDYAASIERVKDCGWYWGPISGETAEKLLAGEPDGSFVVRDSSDEHYIFSLTFKLNGLVRHVRIEHDHGNFSFGCLQKFRSNTIVDFIDSAVAHSRSGRYLFFLHRRPILGPMRVQLLHPVSRFKQVQSLQHMCRFIILKTLRRDLIDCLPLPRRLKDYLNTPHYYSEELATQSLLTKKCTENNNNNNNNRSLSMSSSRSSQSGTPPRAENVSSNPQSNCG